MVLLFRTAPNPSAEVDPVGWTLERGVAALKKAIIGVQREENQRNASARGYARFAISDLQVGVTALATLTLLECGIPAGDPVVAKRLPVLREASITATHTYTLALLIMLFDRAGDSNDVPLIRSMALRLLADQYYADGWRYYCPAAAPEEVKKLIKLLLKGCQDDPRKAERSERMVPPLPEDVQKQLEKLRRMRRYVLPSKENFQGRGDNSNTQRDSAAASAGPTGIP